MTTSSSAKIRTLTKTAPARERRDAAPRLALFGVMTGSKMIPPARRARPGHAQANALAAGEASHARVLRFSHPPAQSSSLYARRYVAGNAPIFEKFGARVLVRAHKFEVPEGSSRALHAVIEFPDYASAMACYHSPEYQSNKKIRDGHLDADLVIVEGYDEPQPRGQAAPQRFSGLFAR
jgi:uncharacterized protein (DUF1330 family)